MKPNRAIFICKKCGARKEIPEDMDWTFCCDKAMTMAFTYSLLTPSNLHN